MDIFGTTVLVITEIYNITMFIRGVVTDIKTRDSDRQDLKDKLDHELLFLDSFKKLFFDPSGTFICDNRLPNNLKQDVDIILSALRKALAEYGMLAAKHGLLANGDTGMIKNSPENNTTLGSLHKDLHIKVREIKKRTFDWALFDKGKLLKTLEVYSGWTERLRQTMSLMLLTLSAFDGNHYPLERVAGSTRARNLGIQSVAKRQLLARSDPPESFVALGGRIIAGSEIGTSGNAKLATYVNDWGVSEEVVVEYRNYNNELIRATDFKSPLEEALKASTRNLAWLLHKSFPPDPQVEASETSERTRFLTLRCLGYIDQPSQYRFLFLYKLPSNSIIQGVSTLHDLINGNIQPKRLSTKPSLGNRFFIAHALTSTVMNIHSLGWVHKNIWSRGVVLFQSAGSSSCSQSQWLVPYLTGWGAARSVMDTTELAVVDEVETNFYQHPVRQRQPKSPFDIEHDIYAVGVVLLEIGLWQTINVLFKTQIDQATLTNSLPEPEMIRSALVEKARTDLAKEMGESYMIAVLKCLEGDFELRENDERRSALLIAFRQAVIEVTAKGVVL